MDLSKRDLAIKLFFERGYQINSFGDIFNKKGVKLNPYDDGKGYKTFCLRVSRKETYKAPVHRIQAYKKYKDDIFNKKLVVRHLNSNTFDNSEDNIVLGTQSENMCDKPNKLRSFRHPQEKILKDLSDGKTIKEVMEIYNIKCKQTVHKMIERNK